MYQLLEMWFDFINSSNDVTNYDVKQFLSKNISANIDKFINSLQYNEPQEAESLKNSFKSLKQRITNFDTITFVH
jgi:hypothetical protein